MWDIPKLKTSVDYKDGRHKVASQNGGLVLTLQEANKHKPYDMVMACSGGLDSTVLLAKIQQPHDLNDTQPFPNVLCVNFQYGSKHNLRENLSFHKVMDHYNCDHLEVNFGDLFQCFGSSLMAGDKQLVPEGHYEEESMRSTVVPGRNTIFASYLAGLAESVRAKCVVLGIHAGDHFIYPDCRPAWRWAMSQVVSESTVGKARVEAPFIGMTKQMIVADGIRLNVPFEKTWTCYKGGNGFGGDKACGLCGSCVERRSSFILNGIDDPLEYEHRGPLPQKEVK